MSTGIGQTTDSREFLQLRVAAFGRTVAIILFISLIGRILLGVAFGYWRGEVAHPSFWAHSAAWIPVAVVWWICRSRPLPTQAIQVVEGVGLVLTSVCLVTMGAYLPAAAGAATTTAYALSFGLIARAVFVPSTARHTVWLGLAIGLALVVAVYVNFLHVDLEVWNGHGFFRKIDDPSRLARSQSIQIGFAWALTTLLAAWATRVIHGLRKDARNAKKLGQYIVETKIGEGGMGAVYRAQHGMLKRPTAIKLLVAERNAQVDIDRFRREVQMTAKLRHPNTVTIYDYGRTDDGTFYYAMELLDGVTLMEIVQAEGRLPAPRVIHVMRQCAMALQEAHAIGLVHRDIKPNNIMLTQLGGVYDVTKVLDFGLVKSVDANPDMTKTWSEAIIGTPRFMSPEQILDPPSVDARSDLYSLGAVGYYLLTGRYLFDGGSAIKICAQHLSAVPETPSHATGSAIDSELERIIMRCLEKKRDDRPSSAAEISELLEALPIEPWSQGQALHWWETRGFGVVASRDSQGEVGSLATIHAERFPTET